MNDDSASGADGDVASARVKDTGPALGAVLPGWVAGRRTVSTVPGGLGRVTSLAWLEIVLASAAFAALCVVTLSVAPQLMEPDDYAYRASITGITQGYFLTLSTAQAHALQAQLGGADPGPGAAEPSGPRGVPLISQWVQLPNGRWISEKNPGYPFLAAPFQLLGIIRLAPLCYGALGCLGLFCGARRWLGRFGGATAVGLFCSSGAALLFAWRDYMPTYTEASLIAAGTGALLWAVLADEAAARRRTRAACRRARRLALRQCLPPGLLTAFQATCGQASTRLTVASERLRVLKELTAGDPAADRYAPGDAIHAMSPAAGSGANTALRDAALVCRALSTATDDGEITAAIASGRAQTRRSGHPSRTAHRPPAASPRTSHTSHE